MMLCMKITDIKSMKIEIFLRFSFKMGFLMSGVLQFESSESISDTVGSRTIETKDAYRFSTFLRVCTYQKLARES